MKKLVFAALLIPVMGHATTFSCKAIQEGHIDSGSQKVSVDSTFDIQKRIGSIVSTGEDNMTDIPLMSKTYRCAECKDYTVSSTSDVASRLDDMFKES